MDCRCSAHAEEVSALFMRREHKRPSWDPIKDRDRANRIRMLQMPEDEVYLKAGIVQKHEDEENTLLREGATNASHNTSPRTGTVRLDGKRQGLWDPDGLLRRDEEDSAHHENEDAEEPGDK